MTDSNQLKQLLADSLADRLEKGELNSKTGEMEQAKPATLSVALNFLKDYPPDDDRFQSGASVAKIQNLAPSMKFPKGAGAH